MGVFVKTADEWVNLETGASGGGGSSWGDFTTNGDENDSGTYTDGVGREWKWAEWNVAADYSVNLTGGLYWVLTTSAGCSGTSTEMGQPGTVVEGYWEFSAGDTPITVGKAFPKGPNAGQGGGGGPSSIGDYGNQGWTSWGDPNIGRGSYLGYGGGDLAIRYLGYSSTITGEAKGYAPSVLSAAPLRDRPGRSGYDPSSLASDGCVIIATVTNEPSDWNPPGALPGVGGWADVTVVTGVGTKYSYTADGTDWSCFEWTASGSVTSSGGLMECVLVSAGNPNANRECGQVDYGMLNVPGGEQTVTVGTLGGTNFSNSPSAIGPYTTRCVGGGAVPTGSNAPQEGDPTPYVSSITGVEYEYGRGNRTTNFGDATQSGTVTFRVPAANDRTGLPDGPFDTTTLRDKAKSAVKQVVKEKRDSRSNDE
jgi:hypothetical protein